MSPLYDVEKYEPCAQFGEVKRVVCHKPNPNMGAVSLEPGLVKSPTLLFVEQTWVRLHSLLALCPKYNPLEVG